MKQKILDLLNSIKTNLWEEKKKVEPPKPQWPPKYVITPTEIGQILQELDFERIRRAMMLFDTRWLSEDGQTFTPDENQLRWFVGKHLLDTVIHGRVMGECENIERGFHTTYRRLPNGNEFLRTRYALSYAGNIK